MTHVNTDTGIARLKALFDNAQSPLLNIYLTAGYPKRDITPQLIHTLDKAGVDIIEVGMPYSDPLADGPTIQKTGTQAIANGMTLPLLLDQIAGMEQVESPLILMGYFNQVLRFGVQKFVHACQQAGIAGLILPDLPLYEYQQEMESLLQEAGIGFSFLITPQTPESRIRELDFHTTGFLYIVADSSITGKQGEISSRQIDYFKRIEAMELSSPRMIGFGISHREAFTTVSRYASGGIIGSAFLRALEGADDPLIAAEQFVSSILHP